MENDKLTAKSPTAVFWNDFFPDEDSTNGLGFYDDTFDYMGPNKKPWKKMIPRKFYGVDCNRAAFRHDYHYLVGGDGHDRYDADKTFKKEMRALAKAQQRNFILRWLACRRINKYWLAVRLAGSQFFNYKEKKND